MSTPRILLGQLGSNGDCLYATILARQMRRDHPDAEITWAISSQCRPLLVNNPFVDTIWEIPIAGWEQHEAMWHLFEREAIRRLLRYEFDHAVLSQIWPNNFQNFDGTVRPSILRSYGRPITVPMENVIYLTEEEEARVEAYVSATNMRSFANRVVFECSSKSGQSFVTPELAQEIASHVYQTMPDTTFHFSTHLPMDLRHPNSRWAGQLTLRESAG
ncbi:MAG: glycosyltransferase family 9 protein, partial [Gammaproteobacteria bacterium]